MAGRPKNEHVRKDILQALSSFGLPAKPRYATVAQRLETDFGYSFTSLGAAKRWLSHYITDLEAEGRITRDADGFFLPEEAPSRSVPAYVMANVPEGDYRRLIKHLQKSPVVKSVEPLRGFLNIVLRGEWESDAQLTRFIQSAQEYGARDIRVLPVGVPWDGG